MYVSVKPFFLSPSHQLFKILVISCMDFAEHTCTKSFTLQWNGTADLDLAKRKKQQKSRLDSDCFAHCAVLMLALTLPCIVNLPDYFVIIYAHMVMGGLTFFPSRQLYECIIHFSLSLRKFFFFSNKFVSHAKQNHMFDCHFLG